MIKMINLIYFSTTIVYYSLLKNANILSKILVYGYNNLMGIKLNKIAIIEDEISIQQMYKFKLEASGYSVKTANNGLEGISLVKQFKPDLILLDLKMPVMNGDEMLEKLRETYDEINITKIVILTNISHDEIPYRLRLLGMDRYVLKAHHTPSQVVKIINDLIK